MGTWSKGRVKYSYEVKIDIMDLVNAIADKLPGDNDWELEDTEIVITGTANCMASSWYCRATLESPEEYDIELLDSINDLDINKIVTETLKGENDIKINCEIDEDSIEGDDYEPDPDEAYEKWRDSQWD